MEVDGRWQDKVNPQEAQAVAQAAAEFMRSHPRLSLGVVAMNQPQRDLIEQEVQRLTAGDERVLDYRDAWEKEHAPPFVKNLENVQGDERDVIFISLGWGARRKERYTSASFRSIVERTDIGD